MTEPIPMRLICPGRNPDGTPCARLHIDEGEFATKPHHTHACQFCGEVWRPAIVPTVGVQFLPGFKNEPVAVTLVGGFAIAEATGPLLRVSTAIVHAPSCHATAPTPERPDGGCVCGAWRNGR